jgi:hypothetical protein
MCNKLICSGSPMTTRVGFGAQLNDGRGQRL